MRVSFSKSAVFCNGKGRGVRVELPAIKLARSTGESVHQQTGHSLDQQPASAVLLEDQQKHAGYTSE